MNPNQARHTPRSYEPKTTRKPNRALMDASSESGIALLEEAPDIRLTRNTIAVVMHLQGNPEAVADFGVLDPEVLLKVTGGRHKPVTNAVEMLRKTLSYQYAGSILSAANAEVRQNKNTTRMLSGVANRIRRNILGLNIAQD